MSKRKYSQSEDDGDGPDVRRASDRFPRFLEILSGNNNASYDLFWSAQDGDLPKCQTLLAMGADINHNVNPEYNHTPLHTASLNGRTPIVKLLIENGALGTPSKKKFNGY